MMPWQTTFRRRLFVASVLFGLWTVAIEARLVYLQVVVHGEFEAQAKQQQQNVVPILASRGDILDRHGHFLATNAETQSIAVTPAEIPDPAAAVEVLCGAFRDCGPADRQMLLKRFANKRSLFAWVRRRVSEGEAQRVKALKLPYVMFRTEMRRSYPNKELAAHLLGWVGIENTGQGGLEYAYNNQIRGANGRDIVRADAKHRVFNKVQQPPTAGDSIELTIDQTLQHVTERELRSAVAQHHAVAGTAVVMNPRTGEVLAMASEPTFDPNAVAGDMADERFRNRAVAGLYEPGSTFKLVTAAASIQERVMPLDKMIDTAPGQFRVGTYVFRDTANHGVLSFPDVIADSSNVGAIKIGLAVGAERMSKYIAGFGFGHPVSPDFLTESGGRVTPSLSKSDLSLASVSIGYGVSVTPLQMLAAVGAIANNGAYVEPRVVGALYRKGRRIAVTPKVVRQAVTPETSTILTSIMEGVVDHGTGTTARIPGFTVAGKTGTAQKVVGQRYSSDYYASFVGFVPSTAPALAIIVVIDSPRGGTYYGGSVAAPVFQRIAVAALRHLGVAPTVNPPAPVIIPRPVDGSRMVPASNRSSSIDVVANVPEGTVPDVRGMSAREAKRVLAAAGLRVSLGAGTGFVVAQHPGAGATVEPGTVCVLSLERSPRTPVFTEGTQ